MIDSCNRNIDYIRISLTDRCNLRCVYCMPEEGVELLPHEKILTYEEILRLCRCFAQLGIHKVKLTGGEPLVRRGVPWLVEQLKQIDGIDNVTITTNGILLTEQMEALHQAGIDGVNISLDTLDKEAFRQLTRFDSLDRVLRGIDKALEYPDVTTKINCVPLGGETAEQTIIRMAGLAKDRPLHVRFIELMPIGMGKELAGSDEETLKTIISRAYGPMTPYEEILGNGPGVYYGLEGFLGKIGFISAVSHKFCHKCNRIRLTSEGILKNCLQYGGGVNLRDAINAGYTDEELTRLIHDTIEQKPAGHHFGEGRAEEGVSGDIETSGEESGAERKGMSQIGG